MILFTVAVDERNVSIAIMGKTKHRLQLQPNFTTISCMFESFTYDFVYNSTRFLENGKLNGNYLCINLLHIHSDVRLLEYKFVKSFNDEIILQKIGYRKYIIYFLIRMR